MTGNQILSEVVAWMKRLSSIGLLLIVTAMIVDTAAKVIGVHIPIRSPDWSQNNALTIAALAYATGRS